MGDGRSFAPHTAHTTVQRGRRRTDKRISSAFMCAAASPDRWGEQVSMRRSHLQAGLSLFLLVRNCPTGVRTRHASLYQATPGTSNRPSRGALRIIEGHGQEYNHPRSDPLRTPVDCRGNIHDHVTGEAHHLKMCGNALFAHAVVRGSCPRTGKLSGCPGGVRALGCSVLPCRPRQHSSGYVRVFRNCLSHAEPNSQASVSMSAHPLPGNAPTDSD